MKSYRLDFAKLAQEKVGANPEIHVIGIRSINGGFSLLTKYPHNDKYFWSDITSSFKTARVNDKEEFNTAWEAISNALQDDSISSEIFEFINLEDFCKWYLEEIKQKREK